MKISNWTGWRAEEKLVARKCISYMRKLSVGKTEISLKRQLGNSYFLRDLIVAVLEKNNGVFSNDDVFKLNSSIQKITNTNYNYNRMILKTFKLWSKNKGYEEVQRYLTPKSVLYTLRGDYPF